MILERHAQEVTHIGFTEVRIDEDGPSEAVLRDRLRTMVEERGGIVGITKYDNRLMCRLIGTPEYGVFDDEVLQMDGLDWREQRTIRVIRKQRAKEVTE